ncbi:hypothetical protein BCR33DRAFT_712338, partial [Rhizoclosmatium globosum]
IAVDDDRLDGLAAAITEEPGPCVADATWLQVPCCETLMSHPNQIGSLEDGCATGDKGPKSSMHIYASSAGILLASLVGLFSAILSMMLLMLPLIANEIGEIFTVTFLSFNLAIFILCLSPLIIALVTNTYTTERPLRPAAMDVVGGLQVRFFGSTTPTNEYSSSKDSSKICSICLESYHNGDVIRILPCRHEFHVHCVDRWLVDVVETCPLCKQSILVSYIGSMFESGHSEDEVLDYGETDAVVPTQ